MPNAVQQGQADLSRIRYVTTKVLGRLGLVEGPRDIRRRLSRRLAHQHRNRVAYGPLKGFAFSRLSRWGALDRGAMILGLYEKEVLEVIAEESAGRDLFMDIGAADGYYSIGVVSQGLFARSCSFERSDFGRKVIADTAEVNGVRDRVAIHGTADAAAIARHVTPEDLKSAVVLIDIEGAEFDFLDDAMLELFSDCVVVIELHDWFFADGAARRTALEERASARFSVETLVPGARDLSGFSELADLRDDERWLVCSEGRKRPMEWLVLRPACGRGDHGGESPAPA